MKFLAIFALVLSATTFLMSGSAHAVPCEGGATTRDKTLPGESNTPPPTQPTIARPVNQ
jgi:hypothetical protein